MVDRIDRRGFIKLAGLFTGATTWELFVKPTFVFKVASTLFPTQQPTPTNGEAQAETTDSARKVTPTQPPELAPTKKPKAELERRIEAYGVAKSIPAFEYHGDYYNMYPGYYMDPGYFAKQMEWLAINDFHAVTADELVGYLNGELDLPGRSVILTTDSGNTSLNSLPRMVPVLKEYGMHFISFIWTKNMDKGESSVCKEDRCWKTFESALSSGVFSFGCHSETHRDFSKVKASEGLSELRSSMDEIESRLGIKVKCLSWPYEACAYTPDELKSIGLEFAFGGTSRPIMEMAVYPNDPMRYCLPRILPPAPNGVSGRPNNMTMEQIMERYTNYPREFKRSSDEQPIILSNRTQKISDR